MCTNPIFTMATGSMPLKCGKCLECCQEYSALWVQRCMDEASFYCHNCCLTLTYKESDGNLHRDDLQKFIKRLRWHLSKDGINIRYFGCGEYGGKGNRPHYHLIIFGWFPPDSVLLTSKNGINHYSSDFVAKVWSHGFITVGDCDERTVKYCSKYLTKLDPRPHEVKPFTCMSNRPGIGFLSIKDEYAVTGTCYRNGKAYPVPKYYLDKLEQKGYNVDMIKLRRRDIAIQRADEYVDFHKLAYQKYIGDLKLKRLRGK